MFENNLSLIASESERLEDERMAYWFIKGIWELDLGACGNPLNISKWKNSKKRPEGLYAAMYKNSGVFISISPRNAKAFICEMRGSNKAFHTSSIL